MKKTLRGIGIGLFLAGALFTLLGRIDQPISEEKTSTYKEKITQLEQQLADANEQITRLQDPTTDEPIEITSEEKDNTQANETKDEDLVYGTVMIYEGVSLYDIGKQAEDAGVIKNGRELELYLAKPEYSRSIQKGHFELHSGMTLEQMAKTLTGKKVE